MGNPVTWLLLFAVAITSTLVQAQDITFCLASLNSDGKLEFTYSYDSGVDFNTRQRPVVKVTDGTNDLSLHHSIGGSIDNLETLCNENLRVCMADIGLFSDPVVKKLFFGGSEDILSSANPTRFGILSDDADSSVTDCYVVGREIQYFSRDDDQTMLVESDAMVSDSNYHFDLGFDASGNSVSGEDIGITAVPISIRRGYVSGTRNELVSVRINFDDGSYQVFGNEAGAGSVTDNIADVATIEILYDNNATNSTTNPSVCDVRIYNSASTLLTATSPPVDCGSNQDVVSFSVPTGFAFAGFVGFNAFEDPNFTLEPIAYGKLQPQIYYYESNADSSVMVFVNSFFDLTDDFIVEYIYPDGLDGSTLNYHTESDVPAASAGESGEISFSIPSQCGCTMIDIHYSPHFSADDFLQPPDVDAYGYNSAVVSDGGSYIWGVLGNEQYSTGSKYWVTMDQEDLNTTDCTMMRPRTYLADLVDGVPYIDGLMGKVFDSSGADVSLIQQIDVLVNEVIIHDWDDDGVLDGLVLIGVDDISTFEIGLTNDTTPTTLQPPSSNDDRHLLYLAFEQNDQLQIVRVLASFGASLPPCFFDSEPVPDSAGFQEIAGIDLTADMDYDADMYTFYMYMPNDFASITAELTGSFLDFSDVDVTYLLKLTADGSYARTSVITVFFYHLQAETDYSAVFYAETAGGYVTTESLAQTFMTPHGVRMECEENGNMVEQVEWEALPDVEVRMLEDADSYVIDQSVNSVDITTNHARDFQTNQWPDDVYFQFEPNNDNYPKYDDFEGFPKDLLIYYDDTCILGFGLVFETRDDVDLAPVWLAGSQAEYDAANGGVGEDTRASIENMSPTMAVYGDVDTSNNVDCLSAIQLEYDTEFSDCIGPQTGAGCPDLLLAEVFDDNDPAITSDDDLYHIYSFSVSVSDGVIMGLAADYAFVDIPVVLSSDTCVLDDHINYYWLRNTAWTKLFSLDTEFSTCSITKEVYYDHDPDPLQEIFGLDQNDIDGHEIVYRQTLVREADLDEVAIQDSVGGLTIIRQNYWQVNLYCYYEAEATVDNTFSVEGEDEQYIAGTNEFDFELNIYHSNAFDDEYTAVPTLLVGEPVYMAVEMLNTDAEEFYVTAFDCWATETNTQSRDGVDYYTLTGNEGCLSDDTFQWIELNDQFRDGFLFEAFAWYDGSAATTETVYVHCRVEACLMGNDGECTAKNPDQECAKRARRDTDENPMERTKRQSEKVEKIVSASTPFKVQKRDVSNLDIDRSEFSFEGKGSAQMAAGMFSMFATTMFFCLLVISYRIYKLRRSNYARLQDAQTTY